MNTYRIRIGDLRRILREAASEELDEAGFMNKVKAAALGAGIAAVGMGAFPASAQAQKPNVVKQAKLKDPKDNTGKFQFGNLKDPKDNDKVFKFGNLKDPKAAPDTAEKYKGTIDQKFYEEGLSAELNPDGTLPPAVMKRYKEIMKKYAPGSATIPMAAKAFKDGVLKQLESKP